MKVKLGDIFEIGSGGTPSKTHPEYYGGDIPWVKTGDLKTTYLYNVEDTITDEGLKNSSAKMYEPDTVLLAMYGATIGATSILKIPACTNQACAAFKPNDSVVPEYLYYFLRSKRNEFIKDGVGGAQSNISVGYLKNVSVELPKHDEQKEIINVLNRVSDVIDMRKQELLKFDELIKSRFVEMFGNPVTNSMNLPIATLSELSELITKGASPSWQGFSYTDDTTQTLFVTSENVREGYIDISNPKYIEDGFNEKQKRSMLKSGDFLINIVGASIGRAAQFDMDCKANINQAAALVRVADERVRDKYLLVYLNSEKAQQMYSSMKSDTGRANLSLQDIGALTILLPPVEEQIEFEKFIEQVDKSKFKVQQSLEEAQTLFDSLMQEYFG